MVTPTNFTFPETFLLTFNASRPDLYVLLNNLHLNL